MGETNSLTGWKWQADLTTAQKAKLLDGDGVEFKVKLVGANAELWVDGSKMKTYSLGSAYDGKMAQIKKTENPDLVTYGEQSLQVIVPAGESDVSLRMATDTAFFNATTDFSGLSKISFDVYNAQEESRSVRFYLNRFMRTSTQDGTWNYAWEDIWHDDNQYSTSFRFDLNPNGWTHIEITAQEFANKLQPDLSQVDGFYVEFEDGRLYDTDQIYYLDNIRVYIEE